MVQDTSRAPCALSESSPLRSAVDPAPSVGAGALEALPLKGHMPVRAALALILGHLRRALDANAPGAIDGRDPECLHDLRIALRRSRSVFMQLRGQFPKGPAKRFKDDFAWLSVVTGRKRDVDVFLQGFDEHAARLEMADPNLLEPLRALVFGRQNLARLRLVDALQSQRYAEFCTAWHRCVDALALKPVRDNAPTAAEAAGAAITALHRRAMRQGGRAGVDSPIEELHTLRKTCKKLRYLVEAFAALYPEATRRTIVRDLKELQEVLGTLCDCAVQLDLLGVLDLELRNQGEVAPLTFVAVNQFADRVANEGRQQRMLLAEAWSRFARPKRRRQWQETFETGSA